MSPFGVAPISSPWISGDPISRDIPVKRIACPTAVPRHSLPPAARSSAARRPRRPRIRPVSPSGHLSLAVLDAHRRAIGGPSLGGGLLAKPPPNTAPPAREKRGRSARRRCGCMRSSPAGELASKVVQIYDAVEREVFRWPSRSAERGRAAGRAG